MVFYTGQGFLDISEKNPGVKKVDALYVAGINDAMNLHARSDPSLRWMGPCSVQRTSTQLAAIFRKWLRANPERWHEWAPTLYMDALREACEVNE